MDELRDAIVVMGVAHTKLFNGTEGIELIMLDLSTGMDFTLPVTEEQADIIFQHKALGGGHAETERLRPSATAPVGNANQVREPEEVDQF